LEEAARFVPVHLKRGKIPEGPARSLKRDLCKEITTSRKDVRSVTKRWRCQGPENGVTRLEVVKTSGGRRTW